MRMTLICKHLGLSNVSRSRLILAAGMYIVAVGLCHPTSVLSQSPDTQSPTQSQRATSKLAGPYLKWLDEDVRWIVTSNERSDYLTLQNNSERLEFIKEFWLHRKLDSASTENTFRDEHYRRIAYSNTRFASARPGWMTDRGRSYIVYGKPDSIEAYPSGGNGDARPFEVWHYRKLQYNGQPGSGFFVKFVDACKCGDYKLESFPEL